ncbi:hypothetical protein GCM10011519_25040 [Marmoricola endophyticus]|uniref:Uncharacterized protein n=1 Tax=Marmoricola endophyticus TaxID=2040280 RepID=A0A917F5G9_9ACTN|nr:hypothetical protein [Marmoricola endophyticus]GGF50052.1 hypothetical protein GCM10011519_25040 [Marmoricola endophyticus]
MFPARFVRRATLAASLSGALLSVTAAPSLASSPDRAERASSSDGHALLGLQQGDASTGDRQQLGLLSVQRRDGARQAQLLGAQQDAASGEQQQVGVLSSERRGTASQAQLLGAQQNGRSGDQQQLGLLQRQSRDGRAQDQLLGGQQRAADGREQQAGLASTSGPSASPGDQGRVLPMTLGASR